jgi:hypothetical protein
MLRCCVGIATLWLFLAGGISAAIPLANVDNFWLPISDAEMRMKAPVVDPKAGIEAIFWRVHVMDDFSSGEGVRITVHYVRVKVFNQEGKDKAASMELPFGYRSTIGDVYGRTIRSDGTILEASKDAIHETLKVSIGGVKRRAKTLAMPGVEVGSIIEYRWREYEQGGVQRYLRLQFDNDFPVQRAQYFVRPLPADKTTEQMHVWPFNCKASALKQEMDGFDSMVVENVPAYREEPMMPGQPNVRPWVLVYYPEQGDRRDPDKYWDTVGKKTYHEMKQSLKTNGELKEVAVKIAGDAKDDDEKVVLLIRWLHANMRDLYGRDVTEEERAKIVKRYVKGPPRTSVDVYKSGIGDSDELNTLFAALAMEMGLDARPVFVADRDDLVFSKALAEKYFLRNVDMAVTISGKWKIYDVSMRLVPPGMLSWREEGVSALITDPKNPEFMTVPISAPDDSLSTRKGRLSLADDGTLEGDLEETWTGHAAEQRRYGLDGESADRQQEDTKEQILKWFPQAEITALRLENADKPEQPLKLSYHVRIPGYATRTGKRILFQPLFFERGEQPLFSAADRQFDVVFPFPWHERDAIGIRLPDGFNLEKAENPGSLDFGPPGNYALAMTVHDGRLICQRDLTFGKGQIIRVPREMYPQLKRIFDEVHRRDNVTLSLIQSAPAGGTK